MASLNECIGEPYVPLPDLRCVAVADLHGNLPAVPPCDVLLIAGDVCPLHDERIVRQLAWLDGPFRNWLSQVRARYVVGIAGNHDFVFEQPSHESLMLPWHYLQDSSVEIEGVRIYGLPWVPVLRAWAFYADDAKLRERFDRVPESTDVVLAHTPPLGFCDRRFGCEAARDMLARVKPAAYVCGHIHEGYGTADYYGAGDAILGRVYNASRCTILFEPTNEPVAFEVKP